MAATLYRYLFADLLTNQIIGELPIAGVSFTQQLNTAGTLQGHLLLSGVNAAGLNVANATIPGRTALYVDRNGILIWGGIIWLRDYNSTEQKLNITAREFESYFERRRILTTQAFTGVDQLTIAQTLVQQAQAVPYGNIGVIVGTETSGVQVSRVFYNYELKTVFSALQDLSRSSSGFDFNINVAYDGDGNPVKTLGLDYPRIGKTFGNVTAATNDGVNTVYTVPNAFQVGQTVTVSGCGNPTFNCNSASITAADSTSFTIASSTPVGAFSTRGAVTYYSLSTYTPVFEYGGNLVEYDYPEDASVAANTIYTIGAGSNEGKLIGNYTDATKTASGWALLEDAANYSDIYDSTLLANLAYGQALAVSYPPTTMKVVAPAYQDPVFGTYGIGDTVRVRVKDSRFTSGLDTTARIVGINVQPGEDSPERVTLTLTNTLN